jgi:hypothetical protein
MNCLRRLAANAKAAGLCLRLLQQKEERENEKELIHLVPIS